MANFADPLRLGELLRLGDWGLEIRSGGEGALTRPVAGVHCIEVDNPGRWLGPNWVVLTTGIRLRGSCGRQEELIAELDDAGITALGFGTGFSFQEVPHALLAEARRRGFPIFTIPAPTPFREVVTAAGKALAGSDLRNLQRLVSIQRYLVDALQEPDPREALLDRLAKVLAASVFLVGPDGEFEDPNVGPIAERLEAAMLGGPPVSREIMIDGRRMFAASLRGADGTIHGWLVAAFPAGAAASALSRPVLESAVGPLMALARLRQLEFDQRRAARAAGLEELLSGKDLESASIKARALGIDPDKPSQIVLLTPRARDGEFGAGDARRLTEALERSAVDAGIPLLLSARGRELVALVGTAAPSLRDFLLALSHTEPEILIGVGRVVEALEDLSQAYLDARQAVRSLRYAGDPGERVLGFEALDLSSLLISETPHLRVRPKLDQILAVLRENPPLRDALIIFFDNEMDVARSAEALFLHPNSLRYRLRRIEELLGRSMKDPATITSLYIALMADRNSTDAPLPDPAAAATGG
jgi:PucR family transcriptional regulator, purine catabolism regulatory protein